MSRQPARGQRVLLVVLIANIVSTAFHYTDNYLRVQLYPQPSFVSYAFTQVAILIAWPLLTAVGVVGYWLYVRGRDWPARACLLVYSLTGLVSLGHFAAGVPGVQWYWFVNIATDGLSALALVVFVGWAMSQDRATAQPRLNVAANKE